ncbi:DUF3857 domain-containing protein [Yeosuana marina]|uniref:DUF3857 domain-containing protein n=1 Tax=Yeosuana marina TaxID=1565536 RepID=UPI0030EC31CC|tara:strand:+ start:6895 stop:8913 length:2019 start_codon:yes stop_codon:yes gene_type:complete
MKSLFLFMLLSFALTAYSQNYDFGKISKEELQEKFNPLDSSANATYLYKYRRTYFVYRQEEGFSIVTDVHERIKIYNQEGFDYANRIINLHKYHNEDEKVMGLKGYTYNLVDGKIEETKLDKHEVFNVEQSKYTDQEKFTMPNLKEGSVIEYKYKIESPFYWNVEDFVFQYDIPVKKIEASFEAPEYFNFKFNAKGFLIVNPKNTTKSDKITFRYKEREGGNGFGNGVVRTAYSSSNLDFITNITSYDLSNIPALKEEPYVNNIDNYRSAVQYELSYTKFPQSTIKYYSTTWEDVVKTIYTSSDFGNELDKTGYYEDDVDALIETVSDPLKRVALIYSLVKSKVKWNGYTSIYANDGVKKAYKDHVGNAAEINLMLTSMLRYAGLKAYPVLVSTRQHGIPIFPTREGYNYVVTYVKLDEGIMLLDATSKFSLPNVLPTRALNWQGRIIAEGGASELVDLYPKQDSKSNIFMMIDLEENGDIEGNFRSIKTNHDALTYREQYVETDQDQFLEELENKYNGLEISDFKVTNALDLSKPVIESYKFFKESQADIIGDKIYFSPLFYLRTLTNPFKLEKREFPVDFVYPSSSTYRVSINLPEGYKVESKPEPVALMLPDNLGVFKYNLLVTELAVQLVIDTQINTPIVSPLYYDTLKEYFKQLIEKENEQIVLTKI